MRQLVIYLSLFFEQDNAKIHTIADPMASMKGSNYHIGYATAFRFI